MKSKFLIICFLAMIVSTTNESFADETITIRLGEEIQTDDLILQFGNIEDSRCPSDLTCIWEGKVTAMIAIKNQTHRISGVFTPGDTLSHIKPYEITLVDVQPYPISTEDAKYVATINISQEEKKESKVNYKDFRDASGEIICKGYTSEGGFLEYPECGPIDKFLVHVLIIALLVVGIIISAVVIWRKRR